jgi:hypothetical protein
VWWSGPRGLPSESDLALQFIASGSLSDPASSDPAAVRDYCSALLNSPQFLLGGLPAEVPDADSLVPCVRGAACSWPDHCEDFAATADVLGLGAVDCDVDGPFTTITW